MRLGKLEYKPDPLTVKMANFLEVPKVPTQYNFDTSRKPIPLMVLGNNKWGNCVVVSKYNGQMRLERVETRRSLPVVEQDAVEEYMIESFMLNGAGPTKPGDQYDRGLVMLDSFKHWRHVGIKVVAKNGKFYRIAAFGELNAKNHEELRAACFGLGGIYFGFSLPMTAQKQTQNKEPWDNLGDVAGAEPGSWGGHAVYAKAYVPGGFEVLTWGMRQFVTNAFIDRYADEVWAVVDDWDNAKHSRYLDADRLTAYLRGIGASGIT